MVVMMPTIALLLLITAVAGDVIVSCDVVLVGGVAAIVVECGGGAASVHGRGVLGGVFARTRVRVASELSWTWARAGTYVEAIIEGVTHHTYGGKQEQQHYVEGVRDW